MESATGIRSAVGWRKVEDVVELMEAAVLLGNGGQRDGMAIIAALARRMAEARKKHPVFAEGKYHALGVIGEPLLEADAFGLQLIVVLLQCGPLRGLGGVNRRIDGHGV